MARRISIGTWAYAIGPYADRPVPFPEVVERLAELGFDGLELGCFGRHPNPDLLENKDQRDELRCLWQSRGMGCSGLAADLWGQRLITSARPDAYLAAFRKNLRFCEDLEIDVIRVDTTEPPGTLGPVAGERPAGAPIDYDRALKRVVRTWRECAKMAADRGVRIVWEFEPAFAFNKPSDVFRVLDGVDDDNFYALLDTSHANMMAVHGARQVGQPETLREGIRELARRLEGKVGRLHLADSDGTLNDGRTSTHVPLGQGDLDFDELVPALIDAGCPDDWWTIDLSRWPDAWRATEACKQFVDALAKKHETLV
ncbi:MAG: sugar phosphate isomerase/epimerase [Pirellulales bacterium]|nr:sugar phosphate isomerase/epimerase [Pirellulales bacterium]